MLDAATPRSSETRKCYSALQQRQNSSKASRNIENWHASFAASRNLWTVKILTRPSGCVSGLQQRAQNAIYVTQHEAGQFADNKAPPLHKVMYLQGYHASSITVAVTIAD
jgi:hypothetical protein